MEEQHHAWATELKRTQQQARRQAVKNDVADLDDLLSDMAQLKRDLFTTIRKHDVRGAQATYERIIALRAQGLAQQWSAETDDGLRERDLHAFQEDCVALATAIDHMLNQTAPV